MQGDLPPSCQGFVRRGRGSARAGRLRDSGCRPPSQIPNKDLKKLGITKAKLDDAFRSARKAAYLTKIDKALADDRIDEDTAADLKADLEDADLPGYKQSLALRGGFGGPFGGGFGRH